MRQKPIEEYAEWLEDWYHDAVHFFLMQDLEFLDKWAAFRRDQIELREKGIDTRYPQATDTDEPELS